MQARWVVARPGWGGVWAVGVVRAWGGVGTHTLPTKFEPGVGSGEETRARWGAGGGGGEGAGGCGHALAAFKYAGGCGHALAAFKYSLNT